MKKTRRKTFSRTEIKTLASRCSNVITHQLLTDTTIDLNALVAEKNYKTEAGVEVKTLFEMFEAILQYQNLEEGTPGKLYFARGYIAKSRTELAAYDEDDPIKPAEIFTYVLEKKEEA